MDIVVGNINPISPPSNVLFDPITGDLTIEYASFNDGGQSQFDLEVSIDCSVIPAGPNPSNLSFQSIWQATAGVPPTNIAVNCSSGTGSLNCINNECTQAVTYPFLADNNNNPLEFFTYFNENSELVFIFEKTGLTTGPSNLSFQFDPQINCTDVTILSGNHAYEILNVINGVTTVISTGTFLPGNNSWENISIGDNNLLKIKLSVNTSGCITNCNSLVAILQWKCTAGVNNNFFCENCTGGISVPYILKTTAPAIAISSSTLPPDAANCDFTCFGESNFVEWSYEFEHLGGEEVDEVSIIVDNYYSNNLSMLSMINKNDIEISIIQPYCPNCLVTFEEKLDYTANGCATGTNDYLRKYTATVKGFKSGNKFTLTFKTFKCPDNSPDLYNKVKYFNWWQMILNSKNICGGSLPMILDGNVVDNSIPISPYPARMDLDAVFTPQVAMTDVPHMLVVGPQEHLYIEMNKLFPFIASNSNTTCGDDQLVGYLPPGGSYHGYLRVGLHTESGLGLEQNNRQNAVKITKPGLADWTPFYYNSNTFIEQPPQSPNDPPNHYPQCSPGDYYFYFDLNFQNARDYFIDGRLWFSLQGCCGDDGAIDYSVTVEILPNPSAGCCVATPPPLPPPPALEFVDPLLINNQNECKWIPLCKWEEKIQVTCPGCEHPGIEVDSYRLERITLGLEDSDLDLEPDPGASSPISWEPNMTPDYNTHYANHGDVVLDRMIANLNQGDNSSGGYTLFDIYNANGKLPDVLQLHRKITHTGFAAGAMNLHPKSIKLLIDQQVLPGQQPCTLLYSNKFSDLIDQVYISSYETVWAIELDDSSPFWGDFVEIHYENNDNDLIVYFTFSDDDEHIPVDINMNSGVTFSGCNPSNSFPGFTSMQKYRLMVEYHVCGNFTPGDPDDFTTCLKKAESNQTMWISGQRHAYVANDPFSGTTIALSQASAVPGLTSPNPAPNPNSPLDDYVNNHLFWCVSGAGYFHFLSVEAINESRYGMPANPVNCIRNLQVNFLSRIGGTTYKNRFPYEFKTPPFFPSQISFKKPANNYSFSAFSAKSNYLDYNLFGNIELTSSSNAITNFNVFPSNFPDWYDIFVDDGTSGNLALPECTSNTSTLRTGHQQSGLEVTADLIMDPCNDGQVITINPGDIQITYADYSSYGNNTQHYCTNPTVTSAPLCTLATPVINAPPQTNPLITENGLDITFPSPVINVFTKQVKWQLYISNPPVNSEPLVAYHVYIRIPVDAEFTNWKLTKSSSSVSILPNPVTNLFEIGIIYASNSSPDSYELTADYACTTSPKNLSVDWGWNCVGYPTFAVGSPSPCKQETQSLTINKVQTLLNANDKSMADYGLCTPFNKSSTFTINTGALYEPFSLEVIDLPPHLFLNSVTIRKCNDPNNSLTLSPSPGNPMEFNFLGADLITAGFINEFINQGECLEVMLNLTADCAFDRSFPHTLKLEGNDCCQTVVTADATLPGFSMAPGNLSSCTQCFSVTKSPMVTLSGPYQPVSYQIEICNTAGATAGTANLIDMLPENFVVTNPSPCTWCQTPGGPPATPLPITLSSTDPCPVFTVEGFYTDESLCDGSNQNIAQLSFTSATGMPITVVEDEACITINCEQVSDLTLFVDYQTGFSSELIAWNGGNPQFTGFTFYVIGTFTVDATIEFINCTLYMAPGAQIVVSGGASLITNNTQISGCTTMWNRIWVLDESYVYILNDSEIRDANDAIWAENGSRVTIDQSSFYECVRGLFIPPSSTGSFHNIGVRVTGSTFGRQNSPGFKPGYSGQPAHGVIPNCGIEVNDMPMITIGDYASGTNQFVNMSNGIVAHRSRGVLVQNSAYTNIWADVAYNSAHNGSTVVSVGDQAQHGDLSVRPAATGSTMHNCNRGIYTLYSNLRANGLTMTGMRTGVFSTLCTDMLRTDVSGNTIEANFRGIDWFDNEGSGGMSAIGNTIYMAGSPLAIGIETREQNLTGLARYRIEYNYINLNNSDKGISANTTMRPIITCNVIEQYQNISQTGMTGIGVFGGPGAVVTRNQVVAFTNGTIGIVNNMGADGTFICNTVEEQETGLKFDGLCGLSNVISGNVMDDCVVGLYYTGSAVTGLQEHRGNRWVNVPLAGVDQAVNLNTSGFWQSWYFVHVPTGSIFHPQVNPPAWFFHDPSGTPFSCSSIVNCHEYLIAGGSDEVDYSLLQAIVNDSLITVDYPYESRSMARRQLFDMLAWNDSLLNSDTVYVSFYQQLDSSATGRLHAFSQRLSTTELFDSTFTTLLNYTDSLIRLYSDSLVYIDSLAMADTSVNYASWKEAILDQIGLHSGTRANLVAQKQLLTEGIRDSVLVINMNVVPTEIPEWNEREMNNYDFLYKRYGKDSLVAHYNSILSIAVQCPSAGGPAVYMARNLVRLFNDTVQYNDTWACIQVGYYRQPGTTLNTPTSSNSEIRLIPNPASEYVDILVGNRNGEDAMIYFLNINGEEMLTTLLTGDASQTRVSTKHLSPGVYFVKVVSGSKLYPLEKLVIIK